MNSLTPEMARKMDRCALVPHSLDIERAWGIVKIHEERGTCTVDTCYRLAAAKGFIEDHDQPIGLRVTEDGMEIVAADGWGDEPDFRRDAIEDGRVITVDPEAVFDHPQTAIE